MRVLVDLDGVLADFDRTLWELTRAHWPEGYMPEDQQHRFCTDILPRSAQKGVRAATFEPGFFAMLAVIPGAKGGLEALSEAADVWLCSKPLTGNPTCMSDKGEWVRRHFGDYWQRRLILAADKGLVRGDILLDDAPKAEWAAHAEWRPVVFARSWNKPGSVWSMKEGFELAQRWSWGDPVEELLAGGNYLEKIVRNRVLDQRTQAELRKLLREGPLGPLTDYQTDVLP